MHDVKLSQQCQNVFAVQSDWPADQQKYTTLKKKITFAHVPIRARTKFKLLFTKKGNKCMAQPFYTT